MTDNIVSLDQERVKKIHNIIIGSNYYVPTSDPSAPLQALLRNMEIIQGISNGVVSNFFPLTKQNSTIIGMNSKDAIAKLKRKNEIGRIESYMLRTFIRPLNNKRVTTIHLDGDVRENETPDDPHYGEFFSPTFSSRERKLYCSGYSKVHGLKFTEDSKVTGPEFLGLIRILVNE